MSHAVFRQADAERFMRAARSQGATEFRFDLRELTITARLAGEVDSAENPERDAGAGDGVRYGKEDWDEN
jgi:hypothetical protein